MMITYLILIVTCILVGLVAVLLYRRNEGFSPKAFWTGAVANAAVLAGILFYKKRKRS
jgi:hypothetical protein